MESVVEPSTRFDTDRNGNFQVLWEDGDRVLCRRWRPEADGNCSTVLTVSPAAEHPAPATLERLTHEYGLKDSLDRTWAARPLELIREGDRTTLLLEDPGGEPLDLRAANPMEVARFLHLAISTALALGKLHERGLVHKDIKPVNLLVNQDTGSVKLTGFGIASRLPRERQAPAPPEIIAGTLAYMAPEQTGRLNRSVDSRSDLYALGISFYQMLTGALPFTASDPMEWVHCHIARQPVPPSKRLTDVPIALSNVIMKLLAKAAEDRYQTVTGLESDLQRCLSDWEHQGHISDFPPGQYDIPDRLLIPEKLYGRESEVNALLAAFGRVVRSGAPELVLVSGYSGVGKSSVVNELHKALVPPRGLFASGKFDQYKRDIPYSTLVQALQRLVRPLLSKGEAELRDWRDAIQNAVGSNVQLIVDLVPELKLIIGEQSPVPVLPPQDAQRRFQLVFRRFISIFARAEHPLAFFLDDLHWLDAATLDLVEDLLTQPDVRHLMFIGAYRDNEVDSNHPLVRRLEAIRTAGCHVQEVVILPLARDDLEQLIGDSLHCKPERAASLATLVYAKTAGNPFFAIQFLSSLAEEGLLSFDHGRAQWAWDLERIEAKGYTDNVRDLMLEKLHRLPAGTQNVLWQLACLGDSADPELLALICADTADAMRCALHEAVQAGLVLSSERTYRFLHDRVQEAAYSLMPDDVRAATHLQIGRLLLSHTRPEMRNEAIFDIVNQLNRGASLITSQNERDQVARLNLTAGERAKASTAYPAAINYLTNGAALLADDAWGRHHDLVFSLELNRAECEFLTGESAAAERRLSMLSTRAASAIEHSRVTCLQVDLYTILARFDHAVGVCLGYLRCLDIEWSVHPTEEEARREYDHVWLLLGRRAIENLGDLRLMSNPAALATMDVLTKVVPAAYNVDTNLSSLVICRMVNISLEHGNSDGSCFAYVWLAAIAGPRFGNYKTAFEFGRLGYELVDRRGLTRYQARTYMIFGHMVLPSMMHIRAGRELGLRVFEIANEMGDLISAVYSCNYLITDLISSGDPLAEVQRQAEDRLVFARKVRFGLMIDNLSAQLGFIRTLRGLTPKFGSFDESGFDELGYEHRLAGNRVLALSEFRYWVLKIQALFFAGDYPAAVAASCNAQRLLWSSTSHFETAEFRFYGALACAVCWDSAGADERGRHFEVLTIHRNFLELWSENCPQNFENRAALVNAEIERIEGRHLDAMRSYEKAIRSAHANGFVQNEALANELAARFYFAHGFDKNAHAHLRDAHDCYLQWGADGKARQLEELNPYLRRAKPLPGSTSTISTSVEQLDLAAVIKLSQAISGEIVLDRLIDTLMRTAIAQAGAERSLLIVPRDTEPHIEAEAMTRDDMVVVELRREPVTTMALPVSVLQYVLRTREHLVLDEAATELPFSSDPYIRHHQAKSILCLPLITQTKLTGVLYLENNLTTRVFAAARIAMPKLLASQAAIALENARLYGDLAEREAKIRRLVDANIIGIYISRRDGRIVEANDAFLKMLGYDQQDLAIGHLRWTDLTSPQWRDTTAGALEEIDTTGAAQAHEKEYLRKDGGCIPVLIGAAAFDQVRDEGVTFVLDLTELKRAEAAARETQMQLAHANRVATMGQLSASIAHEINQPIGAAVTYADAALRWLGASPPNLEEVREALSLILESGVRAGEVMNRIRALVRKAPPQKARLEINEVILEVVALISREMEKNGILAQKQLAESLPAIQGDRVQLQQVILNLLINAIEAMSGMCEGQRELLISTAKTNSGVVVSVRDSGPGLMPEGIEQLFESFYTTKPGGLGMGLSICRSIIETHGGRLWASANEPRGAIFQFTLSA